MRQAFQEYYRPAESSFDALWGTAFFIPDANVLLNLYRYSADASQNLLMVLELLRKQLWIPHQFALEYHRERAEVIATELSHYASAKQMLDQLVEQLESRKRHPFVSNEALASCKMIGNELKKGRKKLESFISHDTYLHRVTELLEGKVGPPCSIERLGELCILGKARYSRRQPPGFSDSKKPEPDCYSDFIGWEQILTRGAESKQPSIFITDDMKEDWWQYARGDDYLVGPRPELIREYRDRSGQPFYMLSVDKFLSIAGGRLGRVVPPAVIEEVRQQREARLADVSMLKPPPSEVSGRLDDAPKAREVSASLDVSVDVLGPKGTAEDVGDESLKPEASPKEFVGADIAEKPKV